MTKREVLETWKPKRYEPGRVDKCASPANDYKHMWTELADNVAWCALCGHTGKRGTAPWDKEFHGESTPGIYWALQTAQEVGDERELAGQLKEHARMCGKLVSGYTSTGNPDDLPDVWEAKCGDGAWCSDAPKKSQ